MNNGSEENKIISLLMSILFYRRSSVPFSNEEVDVYENMFSKAIQNDGMVNYLTAFPKYRFIDYIIQKKNLVVHGSNNVGIEKFETRNQTLFNGQLVDAIFATKDGIWPIFYAVFDRQKLENNFRNGCLKVRSNKRFYFFSMTKQTMDRDPWTYGMIYFMSSDLFERTSKTPVYFDEWISKLEVRPIMKLMVCKEDFEFANKISIHRPMESMVLTWLLYKIRTTFRE